MNETVTKLLPRAAAAYLIDQKTVLRGGVGLFSYDYFFENINQAGSPQATPVSSRTTAGLTFTGADAVQPAPERAVDSAGRLGSLGLASQLGQSPGTLYLPGTRSALLHAVGSEPAARLRAGLGRSALPTSDRAAATCPWCRRVNSVPIEFLSTSRSRDTANETLDVGNVPEPVRGPAAGQHASTVRRSAAPTCCGRIRISAAPSRVEGYEGSDSYNAGTMQLQKRFSNGNSISDAVHAVVAARRAQLPEPAGRRARGSRLAERPAAPFLDRHACMRLPFGHGERWGRDWNGLTDAFLGGWQVSTHLPVPVGRAADLGHEPLLQRELRQPARPAVEHRREGRRRHRRPRRAGLGHLVLLLQRRAGPGQRRRQPGAAARRSRASMLAQQRPLLPVDAAERADRRPPPAGRRPVEELRAAAQHAAAVAVRGDQRAQLHRAVEPAPEPDATRPSA